MNEAVSPLAGKLVPENNFPKLPRLPGLCTAALNRLSDRYWESALGIQTAGRKPVEYADAHVYESLPYHTYFSVLDALELRAPDVLADLGSGKGRVVCVAARLALKEVVGVEIDPELSGIAEANIARLRGRRAPVRLLCQSATEYDFGGVTALTFFNPFGAATMRQVLGRLEQSLQANPRGVRIAYVNAVHTDLLAAQPWLELYHRWQPTAWGRVKFPVHFYRTVRKTS
jgi:SAM-dependent methyltransferase